MSIEAFMSLLFRAHRQSRLSGNGRASSSADKLGLIDYTDEWQVHRSLLNMVLHNAEPF
jgi:hypothetical protein